MDDFRTITTLQYMGSKTRMVKPICQPVLQNESIDTVVDLFAGTGTIAYALSSHFDVVSNDLELYAYVLNEGILNGCFWPDDKRDCFFAAVQATLEKVCAVIPTAIAAEKKYLSMDVSRYEQYRRFCERTPSVLHLCVENHELSELSHLAGQIIPGQVIQSLDVPALFLTYYANTYFGIRQCAEIDAIRYEIGRIHDGPTRNVLLSALMTAMSAYASTTTHFAQFLKINGPSSFENIRQKRLVSLLAAFREVTEDFAAKGLFLRKYKTCECYNLDYLELLNTIPLDETVMVYADPPYFKEHYSRYYHILNTVCRYDYPQIALNPQTNDYTTGRYRINRSVSPFGKKRTALSAFEDLITVCARSNAWLTISYSDNSIVKIDEILAIMRRHYQVDTIHIPLSHSKQGRGSVSRVEEYLFTGKPLEARAVVGQKQVCQLLNTLSATVPLTDTPASFLHNYMARKPYNIVSEIIRNLCPPDGVVYDPMAGSGTTLIEASKLGRTAIGTDINPLAQKLVSVSLRNWDLDRVETALAAFVDAVAHRCENLYTVQISGETRIIERCYFDKDAANPRILIPTEYWYKVSTGGKLGSRKKAVADATFRQAYYACQGQQTPHVPNRALIPNSRIAIYPKDCVYDYFCARNLIALDIIIDELAKRKSSYGYAVLELLVSSAINLIKLSDKKASSQMPYWTPTSGTTSRNAVMILLQKKTNFVEGLRYLSVQCVSKVESNYESALQNHGVLVCGVAAQNMSYRVLPKDSVDLVLTDPPYTDQVPYLEYSQLWSAVLGWNGISAKRLEQELVVSDAPSRGKDIADFELVFAQILKRTAASLKDGGHFAMFYHSFDLKSWDSILRTMRRFGFAYQGQAPIGSPRKSFKTVMSPNSTLDGNYVIVFRKRRQHVTVFEGTLADAEEKAKACAAGIIAQNQKVTTQMLYDRGMLKDAVEQGYLSVLAEKYKTFADVIAADFTFTNGYWED